MRPEVWSPPVAPSAAEQAVIKAVRRAKLFVFLRQHRHELFDEQFQAELAQALRTSRRGSRRCRPRSWRWRRCGARIFDWGSDVRFVVTAGVVMRRSGTRW